MTALAGHHHVPSLLTGNEPGLSLLTDVFGRRVSAGSSGGILGGTIVPASTRPGSLRRSSSAYSSPSQLFEQNSITRPLPGQSLRLFTRTRLCWNCHRTYAVGTVIPAKAGIHESIASGNLVHPVHPSKETIHDGTQPFAYAYPVSREGTSDQDWSRSVMKLSQSCQILKSRKSCF